MIPVKISGVHFTPVCHERVSFWCDTFIDESAVTLREIFGMVEATPTVPSVTTLNRRLFYIVSGTSCHTIREFDLSKTLKEAVPYVTSDCHVVIWVEFEPLKA
jgi:hypothetical protein